MGFFSKIKDGVGTVAEATLDLVRWLGRYLKSEQAKRDFEWALKNVREALPYVPMVMEIVRSAGAVIPGPVDELAVGVYDMVKGRYPRLFDGSTLTEDEFKVLLLGILTELLKARFPGISTTRARLLGQLAYDEHDGLMKEAKGVVA